MTRFCVYAMVVEIGGATFFKIGWTGQLNQRLSGVQVGCPVAIRQVLVRNVATRHAAREAEKTLHRLLRPFHTLGEWFQLDTANPEHKAAFKLATLTAFGGHDPNDWNWRVLTAAQAMEQGRGQEVVRAIANRMLSADPVNRDRLADAARRAGYVIPSDPDRLITNS